MQFGGRFPDSRFSHFEVNSPKVSGRYREYSRYRETVPETGFDHHCAAVAGVGLGGFSGRNPSKLGILLTDYPTGGGIALTPLSV